MDASEMQPIQLVDQVDEDGSLQTKFKKIDQIESCVERRKLHGVTYEGVLVEWLLNTVCEHIVAWRAKGLSVPRISLNLSPRQLLGVGQTDKILQIATGYDIAPSMLDIGVTEDSLVTEIEKATSVLASLKHARMHTSLDDFGAGYSSLSYLVRLPIDTIKIAKSFFRALLDSDKASAVIRGIVGLARSLGMKTIAEGVEYRQRAEELKDAGCDLIQGYLTSRPLSSVAFWNLCRVAATSKRRYF